MSGLRVRLFPTAFLIALLRCELIGAQNPRDTTKVQPDTAEQWGAIDPGKGFTLASTDQGSLAMSAYVLWRYLNQLPVQQTYFDHLGELQRVNTRNDLQLHRILFSILGWIYLPKLTYVVTVWTVNSTGQVSVVGSITYEVEDRLHIGGGIGGMPGIRSLLGSHPYWLGTDRFLAEEYFRPGFSGGIWMDGRHGSSSRNHGTPVH